MTSPASNVIYLNVIPRPIAHDVTEVDLAAQIRRGMVTKEEIAVRFESMGFASWMAWRGIDIYQSGVLGRGD